MNTSPISEFDKSLVNLLTKNSRTSVHRLSKQLKCSSQKVAFHMNQLENTGLIQKYYTLINPYSLGINYYAFISLQVNVKNRNQVFEDIKKLKDVTSSNKITGKYDITLLVSFQTAKELDNFISNTLKSIPNIQATYTQIFTRQYYCGKQVSGRIKHPSKKPYRSLKLNKTDHALLKILRNNARTNNLQIAKMIGVTHQTIINKIKRLENHNVIRGYTVLTNQTKYGNHVNAFILISTIPNKTASVLSKLRKIKEIIWLDEMTGEYSFHLNISTNDIFTFNQLLTKKINTIPGIRVVETQIVLDCYIKTLI